MKENMKVKICGTCRFHQYDNADRDWICVCSESDYLSDWTDYNDGCECWEVSAGRQDV